jgi:hypothetical protein
MRLWFLALLLAPRLAFAHGGNPAQAVVLEPTMLGPTVDDSYLVQWLDAGPPPPPTGSAMVNLYYTRDIPITFPLGIIPPTLTGTAIFNNMLEELDPNEYLWDTSNVPSGHYWIWSRVDDPPAEASPQYIRFSPAPLTILHPGDSIGPAITLLKPQSEFATSDEFYTLDYQTWDSTGKARIRFEASPDAFRTEPMWFVFADNVAAAPTGTVGFNTAVLDEGDYMFRATITDCEGRSFVAHSRYFLFVAHLDPPDAGPFEIGPSPDGGSIEEWCENVEPYDAGPAADAADADSGNIPDVDGGTPPPPPDETCACTSAHARGDVSLMVLWVSIIFVLVSRKPRHGG